MKKIKAVLTDCDGVLTDGGLYYDSFGRGFKKFFSRDSFGFTYLKDRGILTGVISGDPYTQCLKARKDRLKWDYLFCDALYKPDIIKTIAFENKLTLDEIAYIGDDISDFAVLEAVGLGACPKDAHKSLIGDSNIIALNTKGGKGVFREFVDYLIEHNYV